MTYDARTKRYAREQEDRIAVLDKVRLYRNGGGRKRDDLDRDYARILYSSSFRRLQGKMQLLGIDQIYFYRNRLTHSMEVAQIARAIASNLDLNKTIVAESCSLAHDLGNPPFGHYGETVLNRLASEIGGFEGNAQTFRILSRLEKRHYEYGGLNLTLRTLFGVVKYYFRRERDDQDKFLYEEDYQLVFDNLKKYKLGDEVNTIDKQIMDKADEIAYGAHDLEDSLSLGYFTIDELLYEFRCDSRFREAHDTLDRIVKICRDFAYRAHRLDSSEEFSFLFRKEMTSNIVNTLVTDINYPKDGKKLTFGQHSALAEGLKKLTFKAILRRPAVQLYERRGGRILEGLYNVYTDEQFNKELMLLPPEFRQGHEDSHKRKRNVVDYIAGMMDAFAIQEYQKYYGSGNLERLYMSEDSKKP